MSRENLSIKKFIKTNDMFAYKVNLNFNRNGDSFTTVLGGLATLTLFLMIFILGIIRGSKII